MGSDTDKNPRQKGALHVAIVMDGNGRWARKRLLPRIAGHRVGVDTVRTLVRACRKRGVGALTLFAFSSENWKRPQDEVGALMELFIIALKREAKDLNKNNVPLRVIGDINAFPDKLQRQIHAAEDLSRGNDGLDLLVAANYGGRWDIAQAARALARDAADGRIEVDAIDEQAMSSKMALADWPDPDLFIRTGGEQRISNFLLWQIAYAELYFTDTLWPDFDTEAFDQALAWFSKRQRRFGQTGEQVESGQP
jgi:undecaprenyl diphosphate synthase